MDEYSRETITTQSITGNRVITTKPPATFIHMTTAEAAIVYDALEAAYRRLDTGQWRPVMDEHRRTVLWDHANLIREWLEGVAFWRENGGAWP